MNPACVDPNIAVNRYSLLLIIININEQHKTFRDKSYLSKSIFVKAKSNSKWRMREMYIVSD